MTTSGYLTLIWHKKLTSKNKTITKQMVCVLNVKHVPTTQHADKYYNIKPEDQQVHIVSKEN